MGPVDPGRAHGGERGPAAEQDRQDVDQRLDVVDDGGLAEQSGVDRERRLVARLAAEPLDRVEDRRLFATDVGPGAAEDRDVEAEPGAEDVVADEAPLTRGGERGEQRPGRPRVLAPHVDPSVRAARGVRGDRHRLDHRERIALHQHPVLERAGLGLVGVADEVVGVDRLTGDGLPLAPGRERRAAAADEPGISDLADHRRRTDRQRPAQRLVPTGGAVGVEVRRVSGTDAGEQAQRPRPRGELRHGGGHRGLVLRPVAVDAPAHGHGGRRSQHLPARRLAGLDDERGGRPFADPEARRRVSAGGQVGLGQPAAGATDEVDADVDLPGRPLDRGEQGVERGHPVDVGGRDVEPLGEVVDRPAADPADAVVDGVERRQQQVALRPELAARPARRGGPQDPGRRGERRPVADPRRRRRRRARRRSPRR